ncbi:hypothetical protein GH733_006582, partial [Mirounga leonina]
MKEDAKAGKDNGDAFYNSQKFEVLYCGKVTVAHKKAPSSLIDDCIEKFSLHEQQRLRTQGEQRGADAGDDPGVLEAAAPGPAAHILSEEGDGVPSTQPALPAGASQPGLPSSRAGFPERILEDSGLDERQEFRSRCRSVTGVLQRKAQENSQKPPPRRRHASAPSHVQPSDSEKNRTMLFQVRRAGGWRGPQRAGLARQPVPPAAPCAAPASFRQAGKAGGEQSKGKQRSRQGARGSHGTWILGNKRRNCVEVGRFEINLISPDTKSVVLEKNFKDISSCSQGIKHVDHFGFICRESAEPGMSQYICCVFQCASESLVDEVMLTLKQAFSTAAALQSAKTQIKLCEACPMHSLHKLCERIEGTVELGGGERRVCFGIWE